MSEYTKGKLEYSIVAANAIDIISKEDESIVIASIMSEEDDLGVVEIEHAKHIVKCWNCHDDLIKAIKKAKSTQRGIY